MINTNTNFSAFGLARLGLEPVTSRLYTRPPIRLYYINSCTGPGITTVTQHSALKCLKPLIRRFTLAVWFKPNTILFQFLYETSFDWY